MNYIYDNKRFLFYSTYQYIFINYRNSNLNINKTTANYGMSFFFFNITNLYLKKNSKFKILLKYIDYHYLLN